MKDINKVKMGKKSRRQGKAFELSVRKDLESKGWIVCRWDKQVNLETNQLENSKPKFNPYTRSIMNMSSGFPDFLILMNQGANWKIKLVECKMNGVLDKEEKEKIEWIQNNLYIKVDIASKGEHPGEITYG